MTGRRPTISDVARQAGVSTATAGRVLGGYGYSSEDKRRRVLLAAEDLGYRPNHLARSLITGRTQTIGVVTCDIHRQSSASLVRGIADTARREGFGLLLANSNESLEEEMRAVRDLSGREVDGLIVAPCEPGIGAHLRGLAGQVPLVLVDRDAGDLGIDSVSVDNTGAARDCVRRLLDAGHRDIAMAVELATTENDGAADAVHQMGSERLPVGSNGSASVGWQRLRGYLDAHAERGLTVDPGRVVAVTTRRANAAKQALMSLLQAGTIPDALVAGSGRVTRGAMGAFMEAGFKVPDDLSFVGFEDLDWMRFVAPGLDAIAQPRRRMGETAARLLLDRIEGHSGAPRQMQLTPRQRTRGSVRNLSERG